MNEKYIFILTLAVIVTFFVTVSITGSVIGKTIDDSSVSLTYHSAVCVYKNNELIGPCKHNLVTNAGKDAIKTILGSGAAGQAFFNMSVANSTAAQVVGDTVLQGIWTTCGLAPAAGTYVSAGTGAWNVTYQWTSSCDTAYANATGLYNTTTLFAENTFTTVTLMNGDKLNITWGVWVS